MFRRYMVLGVVVAMAVAAVACSSGDGSTPGSKPTATQSTAATATATTTATATNAPPAATATATTQPTAQVDGAVAGKSLSARNGCTACHSVDGGPSIGPTWKGLFGKEETLADGSTVSVDEDYLRESILDPDAAIVKGYVPGIMPSVFGQTLSDEEIDSIISYIKSVQ